MNKLVAVTPLAAFSVSFIATCRGIPAWRAHQAAQVAIAAIVRPALIAATSTGPVLELEDPAPSRASPASIPEPRRSSQ